MTPGHDTRTSSRAMTYLAYASRGKNEGWRYVVGFIAAPLLTVAVSVAIIIGLQIFHLFPQDFAREIQDPSQPAKFYPANGAVFGLLLLAFVATARIVHKKSFGDIIGQWRWAQFARGLAIWIVVLLAAGALDYLMDPAGFRITASSQTPQLAAAAFAGLAIQTFAEEFVFRGYLTQGLLVATHRIVPTALVSGLLFGAMHIPNGLPQALSATIFGILLAVIAIRTGGIAFTYGLHLANNVFGAVVLISSGDAFHGSPGVITQSTPGLMWWDVGVGAVGLLAVAAWVIFPRRAERGQATS
jgi:membrane protease YdiL (CAAX protease family)